MASHSSLVTDRPAALQRTVSGVKTILLHVQNDSTLDRRLEAALSLARCSNGHLSCIHITPIQAYITSDALGGVFMMNDLIKALDDQEQRVRDRLEGQLRSEEVSWDYTQVTGDVVWQLIRHAALADLIVTGRESHKDDFDGPAIGLLGDLLHRSRTPLFIPGSDQAAVDPTGTAVIAWDGSFEACSAIRSATGLLRLASQVRVVQVREPDKADVFPSTTLLEFLSRHDIHADLQEEPASGAKGGGVAGVLLAHARAAGAAYMVMGGYNHSRIGEYLFGGVTRALLRDCPIPLLIAH